MKKFQLLVAILMSGLFLVANAYAYTIKFETRDYFAWGRLYNTTTGAPLNVNPYDNSTTQTLSPNIYSLPDGTEDAFGITAITKISDIAGTSIIWQESASQELTAFFWGADDVYMGAMDATTWQSPLISNGFVIELWLDTTPDYDVTQGTSGRNLPADPTHYNTVTDDGTMALKLAGHTQYLDYSSGTTNKPYTLQETGHPDTGQFIGSILFDVVGGTWAQFYDTDTIVPGRDNTNADFEFSFSTFTNPSESDWLIGDTSNAVGDIIPEPATMFLFGSGLIGLAGLARKKMFFKKS